MDRASLARWNNSRAVWPRDQCLGAALAKVREDALGLLGKVLEAYATRVAAGEVGGRRYRRCQRRSTERRPASNRTLVRARAEWQDGRDDYVLRRCH